MHPNPHFREEDRAFHEALIAQVGFGMVFVLTPDGPRVAHAPIHSTGKGQLRFHLARGNALTRHLDGQTALIVINGPDAYISARWYSDPDQVSTWNYQAAEMEGPVRQLDNAGLLALLEDLTAHHEAKVKDGQPWTMDKLSSQHRDGLMRGIVGFEMTVESWRETNKLSQNKAEATRAEVIEGLEKEGERAISQLMRDLPA